MPVSNPNVVVPSASLINILPYLYSAIGQGDWAWEQDAGQITNGFLKLGPGANGDNIDYQVGPASGTYSMVIVSVKSASSGIIDFLLDGVEIASFDLYNTPTVYNQRQIVSGIAIANSGLQTLKLRLDGKNGASGGYGCLISMLSLFKTS